MKNSAVRKRHSKFRIPKITLALCVVFAFSLFLPSSSSIPQSELRTPRLEPGQTATQLPDGRLLLVGGEGLDRRPIATAWIWNPLNAQSSALSPLNQPRAFHSATMLPDGTVLILGGVGSDGRVVDVAELFNPSTQSFEPLPSTVLSPRAGHSATLLTDGLVLIAGGRFADGTLLDTAEIWNPRTQTTESLRARLTVARQNHSATLLSDGTVLLTGGQDKDGNKLDTADLFDPSSNSFIPQSEFPSSLSDIRNPQLEASLPSDGSVDVPLDSLIALRFSKSLRVETINSSTVTLVGPKGVERAKVIPAEGGTLAFITPEAPLLPGSNYRLSVNGPIDRDGLLLPLSGLSFTTKRSAISSQPSATSTSQASQSEIQNRALG